MKMKLAIVPFIFIALTLFVASAGVNLTVFAQPQKPHFIADLSGKSAIPPNLSTKATGKAIFTVTDGGNKMLYSVNATKINGVTDVVLVFSRGEPLRASDVAYLRLGSQQGPTGPINGALVQGNITSSNLLGPLEGKHISDLIKDMIDGHIYLWVTTAMSPPGIAGKVTPAS